MMEWIKKKPCWVKVILKVLMVLCIAFVVIYIIPRTINYLILKPAKFEVIGDGTHWLSFWASYLATIASFVMAFLTWKSLRQNKKQLEEMKQQWENEHRPYVEVYQIQENPLITDKKRIEFVNLGLSSATNIKFSIEEDVLQHLSSEGKEVVQSFGDFNYFSLFPRETRIFTLCEHRKIQGEDKYLIGERTVSKDDYNSFIEFFKGKNNVIRIYGSYNIKYKFEAAICRSNSRESLKNKE